MAIRSRLALFRPLRRLEAAIRVVRRIVEEQLEVTVPQRSTRGIKIEGTDCLCWLGRGFEGCVGIEFKNIVAVPEFG